MFREMRLKEQELSKEETIEILETVSYGTMAINDENGYPYSVPTTYIYHDGKIYFHGATDGQKHQLLTQNPHVGFSVVKLADVQPKKYTMFYRSAMVYGTVRRLETREEIMGAMQLAAKKYSPGLEEGGEKYAKAQFGNFCAYELTIEHMTGKRSE